MEKERPSFYFTALFIIGMALLGYESINQSGEIQCGGKTEWDSNYHVAVCRHKDSFDVYVDSHVTHFEGKFILIWLEHIYFIEKQTALEEVFRIDLKSGACEFIIAYSPEWFLQS